MFEILLVFIALKWIGAVDWSWAIVFIPLYLDIIIGIGIMLFDWCLNSLN